VPWHQDRGRPRASPSSSGRTRKVPEGCRLRLYLDAEVIIMGSRGRGDLAGLVLGSTAHKVIHLADRPVLVVR
jgi:nucleotide-binding universal stress UspA family protein